MTEGLGEASARMKPDIFIRTRSSDALSLPKGSIPAAEFMILGPGEYEIKGIEIMGYPRFIYHIRTEDIDLGFLGPTDVKEPAFNADVTEKLQDVDILFVPDSVEGAKIVRQFHPKIVISQMDTAKDLEKELGKKAEILDKLVIKKKEVPIEEVGRLICLKI